MITVTSLSPAVDKIYFADNFKAGNLYRVKNSVKSAGGKGINVARVANTLGEQVAAIGFKAGETGRWLESRLDMLGVHTDFIEIDGESRTNNNIIDRVNHTETEVLEEGPSVNEEALRAFSGLFEKHLQSTRVLVCTGGLPMGIPADFYRELIQRAKQKGIITMLDASGEVLMEGIKAGPHVIKPNLRELSSYTGRELNTLDEIIDACKMIISKGIQIVAASLGAEGALLVSESEILYARPPEMNVVNTIGSGDSMVAGMAAALCKGLGYEPILRLGMACAVTNTQYMEIGVVDMDNVERYGKEIIIRRML